MLQIIGWLGCVYLLVKALEIAGSSAHHDEEGRMTKASSMAFILAVVGALLFALWFYNQGSAGGAALSGATTNSARYSACLEGAETFAEVTECVDLID